MNRDTNYFAYGANLLIDVEEQGAVPGRDPRAACLKGYRLAFNVRADDGAIYANIVHSPDGVVWGMVYSCDPATMTHLDRYEGIHTGLYRKINVTVKMMDGREIEAQVYVGGDRFVVDGGGPAPAYLQRIMQGARAHGLPVDYIRGIERLGR